MPQDTEHSSWGGYRVVYSKQAQRPFYYHIETGIGSWEMPVVLTEIEQSLPSSSSSGPSFQSQEMQNGSNNVKGTPVSISNNVTRSSSRKRKHSISQSQVESQESLQYYDQHILNERDEDIQDAVLSLSATSEIGDTIVDKKEQETIEVAATDTKISDGNEDVVIASKESAEVPQVTVTSTSMQLSVEGGNLAWNCNICTFLILITH